MSSARVRIDLVLLLLSVAGGGVDAIMILGFKVLTAAQTGNTITLAVAIAQGRFAVSVHAAVSVISFAAGSAAGELGVLRQACAGRGGSPIRQAIAIEFGVLVILLAAWIASGPRPSVATAACLVALAAGAMGIQSSAGLSLHAGLSTTYITGALSTFVTESIRRRFRSSPEPVSGEAKQRQKGAWSGRGPAIFGVDWGVYLGGACISALLYARFGRLALLLPALAVLLAIPAHVAPDRP